MAHLDKFTKGQTGGLTRHFERHKKENGEYIKFGNQEIDTESYCQVIVGKTLFFPDIHICLIFEAVV